MAYGTKLIVGNGSGNFCAWFLGWIDDTHISCINKFGNVISISQNDVLEYFV